MRVGPNVLEDLERELTFLEGGANIFEDLEREITFLEGGS